MHWTLSRVWQLWNTCTDQWFILSYLTPPSVGRKRIHGRLETEGMVAFVTHVADKHFSVLPWVSNWARKRESYTNWERIALTRKHSQRFATVTSFQQLFQDSPPLMQTQSFVLVSIEDLHCLAQQRESGKWGNLVPSSSTTPSECDNPTEPVFIHKYRIYRNIIMALWPI